MAAVRRSRLVRREDHGYHQSYRIYLSVGCVAFVNCLYAPLKLADDASPNTAQVVFVSEKQSGRARCASLVNIQVVERNAGE